ncbi:sporulation protein [Pseudobacillus badius]|uniref:sporulation protein n=1 Tax=Bacillus badius TaxID=1455 RepID=UPI0009EE4F52|nr:sporulation protein [Bacillus badius]
MMWKNILSSIGIGGVAIDTVLEKTDYHAGEKMKGKVLINGGQAAEPIDALVISWYLQIHEVREDSDFSYHDKELKEMIIPIQRDIQPKEKLTIPFTLEIDAEHPPTSAAHQTFLKTTAVIPQAVDPFDQDEVIILPKRK